MPSAASNGTRWTAHTGMAEIAGVTKETIKAWSQRSTRLREWAKKQSRHRRRRAHRRTTGRRAESDKTRPAGVAGPGTSSKVVLGAPTRAACSWTATHTRRARRAARRTPAHAGRGAYRRDGRAYRQTRVHPRRHGRTRRHATTGRRTRRPARADRSRSYDDVSVRISAPRQAHHREGPRKVHHRRGHRRRAARLRDGRRHRQPHAPGCAHHRPRRSVGRSAARHPQHRVVTVSGAAAAGTGGRGQDAFAAGAARRRDRARKQVLVLAPTGKAVDEAMHEGAGDRGSRWPRR